MTDISKLKELEQKKKYYEKKFLSKSETDDYKKEFKQTFKGKHFTLKEVLIDRRKMLMERFLQSEIAGLDSVYKDIYSQMKPSISHLMDLGLDIPEVFRLAAKYTIGSDLEARLEKQKDFSDKKFQNEMKTIKEEADKFTVNLNKTNAAEILRKKIQKR